MPPVEARLKLEAERLALKDRIADNDARLKEARLKLEAEKRTLKDRIADNEARIIQNLCCIHILSELKKDRANSRLGRKELSNPCDCRFCGHL